MLKYRAWIPRITTRAYGAAARPIKGGAMRLYAITMFIHILGVIALFGGFAMQQRAGGRLRDAVDTSSARPWSEVLTMTRPIVPSGAVMLLGTGAYLSFRMSGAHPAVWVMVAAVTVTCIGIAAIAIVIPGFAAIATSLSRGDGSLSPGAASAIGAPLTWSALAASNGAAIGTLWLMTAKPGLLEAVVAVTLPATIGGIVGARLGRRARVGVRAGATA